MDGTKQQAVASRFRPDIQALRAVAALGVVIFHLWPAQLPGGFVGVDIFFVISGYLITSHIRREVAETGKLKLRAFWGRRIRRLLPAAMLVLLATCGGIYLFASSGLWEQYFRENIASALYFENWQLALDSVDYLAAENLASPAQHYWSLSLEEQFYLLWPLLLSAVIVATRKRIGARLAVMRVTLALILLASLYCAITMTYSADSAPAYFVTQTRAWEFATGGLIALFSPYIAAWLRTAMRITGAALLAVAFCVISPLWPFPGVAALIPVCGVGLVLLAGKQTPGSVGHRAISWWPVQALGDCSYSIYLWHWPLIVLIVPILEWSNMALARPAAGIAALALGGLTTYYLERPIRFGRFWKKLPRTYLLGAFTMVLVCAASWPGLQYVQAETDQNVAVVQQLLVDKTECFGADAFLNPDQPCENPQLDQMLLPSLTSRKIDVANAYDCYDQKPGAELISCSFGEVQAPEKRIALTGDSHAAMLIPALAEIAERNSWEITTYVARGCVWGGAGDASRCGDYREALEKRFAAEKYDAILITRSREKDGFDAVTAQKIWGQQLPAETKLIGVVDNPHLSEKMNSCLDLAKTPAEVGECQMTEKQAWREQDGFAEAVQQVGTLLDFSAAYCQGKVCPGIIGHVIVYRDQHHLTATFSKTLAPFLDEELKKVFD